MYRYIEMVSEQIHILTGRYGAQVWTRGRKRGAPVECEVTGETIESGTECYRPVSNGMNRMHRISKAGMERLQEKTR